MTGRALSTVMAVLLVACRGREASVQPSESPNCAVTIVRVDGGLLGGDPVLDEITRSDFEELLSQRAEAINKACAPRLHAPARGTVHIRVFGNGRVLAEYTRREATIECAAHEISKWTVPRTQKSSEFTVRVHVP